MGTAEVEIIAPVNHKSQYSDAFKANALIAVKLNEGNVTKTARELGIPWQTLQDWAVKGEGINAAVLEYQRGVKGPLADAFETASRIFLERAMDPEAVGKTSAYYAMLAASDAFKSCQLGRGLPTSITENNNVESRQVLALLIQAIAPVTSHNESPGTDNCLTPTE